MILADFIFGLHSVSINLTSNRRNYQVIAKRYKFLSVEQMLNIDIISMMSKQNYFNAFSGKNVLIIGGSGFVGQNLVYKLLSADCRVSVLDIKDSFKHKEINFIKGSVINPDDVEKGVKTKDIVINLAALRPIESSLDPVRDLNITLRGALNILEACRKERQKKCKLIFFGSSLEYGMVKNFPVSEDNNSFNPNSFYGVHKLSVTHYCRIYNRLFGIDSTVLRFPHLYGPEKFRPDKKMGIVNHFIYSALRGKELEVFGSGLQLRDYLYIDDAIEAIEKAVRRKNSSGQTFNIGTGNPVSILQLAKMIVRIAGKGRVKKVKWPSSYRLIEQGNFYTDYEKAKRMLYWRPRVNLESGIRLTIQEVTGK